MCRHLLCLLLLAAAACQRQEPAPAPPASAPPALAFEPEPRPLLRGPGREPRLVVRASGDLYALAVQPREGGGADLVLTTSEDGGDSFGPPRVLNTVPGEVRAGHGGTPLLLLGPRSEFYAVWAGTTALRVARSRTYGRSFEPPVDVPTGGEGPPSFFGAEVAPDGTLLLAWLGAVPGRETPPGTSLVSFAASKDGQAFDVSPGVHAAVCPCCRPAVVADGAGRWFLAYRGASAGVRDIVVSESRDRGKTWGAPVLVSKDGWRIDGCPHSGPALAVAAGRLHVAWYSEASGSPHLYWTRAGGAGLDFEPRRDLSGALLDANQPSLAVQGDAVYAAFQARAAGEREGWAPLAVHVRELADGAPAPVALARGAGSATSPQLRSVGAGRWVAVWTDKAEGGRAVLARGRTRR